MTKQGPLCTQENIFFSVVQICGQKNGDKDFDVTMGSFDGA